MTNGTIMRLAALAGAMLLAGCLGGGGGGAGTLSAEDIEKVRSDSRVVRAKRIFERADTLLIPSLYLEVTLSVRGKSESEEFALRGQCLGTECDVSDGDTQLTIGLEDLMTEDLILPRGVDLTKAEFGKRDGFDTLIVEGRDRISERVSDEVLITAVGSATSYGVWGQHGFAAVELAAGSLEEGSISGRMDGALAYAFGDRNPTNPEGTGSATWQGPAEAASTRTFTCATRARRPSPFRTWPGPRSTPRSSWTATTSARPPGRTWPSRWAASRRGRRVGEDYMAGNFHGSDHEEAYGVFDTGAYVGAFGAMKQAQ